MKDKKMSHIDDRGQARMVDISEKSGSNRTATASARLSISIKLLTMLKENSLKKGDALATARIAGIMAAKQTDKLIPLCHPLPLNFIAVDLELEDNPPAVKITTEARTSYKTGVEMEALTAASIAALTLYDMVKSVERGVTIEYIRLESKAGGKSGSWQRNKE